MEGMKSVSKWLREQASRLLHPLKEGTANETRPEAPEEAEIPEAPLYVSDQPIEKVADDRLKRWTFAERIADTLATRHDPSSIVVGIYGPWGDGKTSVLRLMEIALREHGNTIPVRFNPWFFGSQEQLLQGFFKTLAQKAGESLSTKTEDVGKLLEKYGSLLSIASLTVGGIVQIGAGDAAVSVGKALSTIELDIMKERLEKILQKSGKRIVIMIDDIDRLDRDEIHAIFKLVKLSAGFDRTSYVLAFDDEMVSSALGTKYGDGGASAGRSFLEKIVQIPLHLPAADDIELRRMTFEGINAALTLSRIELTQEQVDAFTRHFVDGLEERLLTPRQAKLYANALTFALPILKGEVHPVDHMLIEGIRIFYPKLYKVIRENPARFLSRGRDGRRQADDDKRANELIDAALKEAGVADAEQIKERLLKPLFSRYERNVTHGDDWDRIWANEQRVCSEEYFKRYFQYSVPAGDVPDLVAEAFINEVETKDDSEIDEALKSFGERNGMASFVKKLRFKEIPIRSEVAPRLALAFARNGAHVPRERQLFSDWSFTQAAILISELVRKVSAGKKRDDLAVEVASVAEPLPFAFECMRWLRRDKDEKESKRLISDAIEKKLGRTLAERIKAKAAESPLYKTYGNDTPRLLWVWNEYGKHADVEAHLKKSLNANPTEVHDFLDTYVGVGWGIENGLPSRSEFRRDNYDAVAKLISPDFIMEKLREQHGSELDHPEFHHGRGTPMQKQVAHQFAFVYQEVLDEKKPKAPESTKSRPRVDLAQNMMVSSGPDGNKISFEVTNGGDKPAVDIEFALEADDMKAGTWTPVVLRLSPSEKTRAIEYRYDPTAFFAKELKKPRITFKYKDQKGSTFTSGRYLQQEKRADGNYNIHGRPLEYFEQ